ncbi:MAG: radical SAM protein [bacterium]
MIAAYPSYLAHLESGELERRSRALRAELTRCTLCPRRCGADRSDPRSAHCGIGLRARVAAAHPHFGEERVISGRRGSGTIFFAGCSLRCWFCQNADISHLRSGKEVSAESLAGTMLDLQGQGVHNINLVTPTHVAPHILEALVVAARKGLRLPLVYNSGGYDSVRTLRMLDGVVDVYMPDFKYAHPKPARRLSGAADYPRAARMALIEMHRQVGHLVTGPAGIAYRGLLVRHLVLPDDQAGTRSCMQFLAETLGSRTHVNLMDQYRPAYLSHRRPEVDRPLKRAEYLDALRAAEEAGVTVLSG